MLFRSYHNEEPIIARLKFDCSKLDDRIKTVEFYPADESYTEDKKRIYLCLRDENDKYYDYNMLMYVSLHELAHAFSQGVDTSHSSKEFKDNFRDLLKKGEQLGLYDPKKPLTPIDLWNFVADYEDKNGGVNTCFIDSWKNLYHNMQEFGGREDLYLDYVLSYRNELAEAKRRHFMTIAHPKKMEVLINKDTDKPKGRIPDADDIKGGSAWNSNGKTIITVDYPDRNKQTVDLYFNKVKPDTLGRANVLFEMLEFDWRKSRYLEVIEGKICYAGQGKEHREKGEFIGFAGINEQTPF